MAGGIIALLLGLVAVFAGPLSAWYGHDWTTQNPHLLDPATTMPIGPLSGASSDHWLGITPVLGQRHPRGAHLRRPDLADHRDRWRRCCRWCSASRWASSRATPAAGATR